MSLSDEMRDTLIKTALNAREWAYVPYSGYKVGAALLSASGVIYEGVNIENASYSPTVCGERVAFFKAVSEGERQFEAIAVATENGGSPCGVCRQVMAEFSLDMRVICVDAQGTVTIDCTARDLLPYAFSPNDLSK